MTGRPASLPSLEVTWQDRLVTSLKYGTNPDSAKTLCFIFFERGLRLRDVRYILRNIKDDLVTEGTLLEYWKQWKKILGRQESKNHQGI